MSSARKCCAINCGRRRTRDEPLKVHSFPRNELLCMEWVKRANNPILMNKPMNKICKSYFLCEYHFTPEQYMCPIRKRLHIGALPSIFQASSTDCMTSASLLESSSARPDFSDLASSTSPPPQYQCILSPVKPQKLPPSNTSVPSAFYPGAHSPLFSPVTQAPQCPLSNEIPSSTSLSSSIIPSDTVSLPVTSQSVPASLSEDEEVTHAVPSTSTPKTSKSLIKNFSCRRLMDSTPRKKHLYQRLRQCSKRASYMKKRQESLKNISIIIKRESDTVEKLLSSINCNGSKKILASLVRNSTLHKNARRWTTQEKIVFLSFYKRSPKAYRYLSSILNVPSVTTLKSLLQCMPFSPGINPFVFKFLKQRVRRMEEKDKICALLFDEMSIKRSLVYNPRLDLIEGFQDFGGEGRKNVIASEALVFMVRGLTQKWKQPVAFYFSSGSTPATILSKLLVEVITALKDTGLQVAATVCDMGSNNTSALRSMGSTKILPYIRIDNEEIYTVYDPPHLLKCTRNMFLKYCIEGKVVIGGAEVMGLGKWAHIEEAVTLSRQYSGNVVAFPKMTDACFNPKWREKMKVSLAAQVFSHPLASQMDVFVGLGLMDNGAGITAEFLCFVIDLFHSLNSCEGKLGVEDLQSPMHPGSPHIRFWESALRRLKSFRYLKVKYSPDGDIFLLPSGKPKILKVIRPKSLDGWITTIRAVTLIWARLQKEGVTRLETRRLNQDPLENTFGSVRFHCGCNSDPTVQQFISAIKLSMVSGTPKVGSKGGNCEPDTDDFLSDMEPFLNAIPDKLETSPEVTFTVSADDPQPVETITHQVHLLRLTNKIVRNILQHNDCTNCTSSLYTDGSVIGESFCKDDAILCGGRNMYPAEKLLTSVHKTLRCLQGIISSLATEKGLKKALIEHSSAVDNFSWVSCETHNLSQQVSHAVVEYVINDYCRNKN